MVTRSRDATCPAVVDWTSLPSATTLIAMSRSVIVPTSRSPSTSGTMPTFSSRMIFAASTTELSLATVFGFHVIRS